MVLSSVWHRCEGGWTGYSHSDSEKGSAKARSLAGQRWEPGCHHFILLPSSQWLGDMDYALFGVYCFLQYGGWAEKFDEWVGILKT